MEKEATESEKKHRSRRRRPRPCRRCDNPATKTDATIATEEKELHIAPMLDYSKREFRKLFSILSTKLVLWSDMVVDDTILHSDKLQDVLGGDPDLPNVQICQIGGNEPSSCARATAILLDKTETTTTTTTTATANDNGCSYRDIYQEINLNVDCPSPKVSCEREFGAVLMKKVDLTYRILESMQQQQQTHNNHDNNNNVVPISIKCRVGVDDWDDLEFLEAFIERLRPVCQRFVLHARTCILDGLVTARQNRSIPPLNFPRVYDVCRRFPDCDFWINGGIRTLSHAKAIVMDDGMVVVEEEEDNDGGTKDNGRVHRVPCSICNLPYGSCTAPPTRRIPSNLRGVMMGRAAIDNPALFADVDRYFYGLDSNPCQTRRQVLERYIEYLETLYPRRCCDDDSRITYRLPVPENIDHISKYCPICDPTTSNDDVETEYDNGNEPQLKITSKIIGRALKPVRGLFYGMPKGKKFIQALEHANNKRLRNCGPGFILKTAMNSMPGKLLDQEFAKTR